MIFMYTYLNTIYGDDTTMESHMNKGTSLEPLESLERLLFVEKHLFEITIKKSPKVHITSLWKGNVTVTSAYVHKM